MVSYQFLKIVGYSSHQHHLIGRFNAAGIDLSHTGKVYQGAKHRLHGALPDGSSGTLFS